MAIDYRVLLEGLSDTGDLVNDGEAHGLSAIDSLLGTVTDATGAAGATYTEYGDTGGRVVAAAGVMAWSLGQPIAPEFVDPAQPAEAWAGRVDLLPVQFAEPLLSRDIGGLAGHPVASSKRVFGSVHLYFTEADSDVFDEIMPVLRILANAIAHLCTDDETPPTALPPEADDRTLFLAVTGHELRTPVTVIKGYASTLAYRWDSLDEPRRRESALVLTQRADELARLVDRLLAASVGAPAAGWLVRTVPFDLVEALLRAASEMPGELRRALRLDLPNSLPPAYGDPTILVSVLGELVTNAVRYSSAADDGGGVEITAGADARTVFVRVCDRGIGIDPAHVEVAFERFWRAERNGDAHRPGVGLGLYLVRRLVERQNGWVSLRPRDGGGAVAEIRLPRADGPLRPPAPGEA
jgi:two-component system phosphate regulon sensor histidine kinase PhoR